MKPTGQYVVDVESILAQCVAIRLKHHIEKGEIQRRIVQFHELYPRKRMLQICVTKDVLPAKRLCKKL